MNDAHAREDLSSQFEMNFWVEASAGSGKTHSLTQRIVEGLVKGVYQPESLVAVTFTRKAAAELRVRLRQSLEQRKSNEILAQLDRLFIGTVHSFCAHILRMFPVQAGISPGFREVHELEEHRLRRECLREGWEGPEGRALLRVLSQFEADSQDLLPALDWMVNHSHLTYPCEQLEAPELRPAWSAVSEFRNFLSQALPESAEEKPTCKILGAGLALIQGPAYGDLKQLLRVLRLWEPDLKPVKRYWGVNRAQQECALAEIAEHVSRFQDRVARPFLLRARGHLYSKLVPFLDRVRKNCQQRRREFGWVSQQDLLQGAVHLLRQQPEVRRSLRARFRHLLVDEFQDTDPLQAEMFWLLAGPGKDWRQVSPRPGSLCLVGDPKQSIYRFRQADIQVVQEVKELMQKTGGASLALTTSFRSQPALCRWLNHTFSQLFPSGPGREQAHFSPLESHQIEGELPPVFQLLTDNIQQEGQQIAAGILSRVTAMKTHQYSDFLLLTARKAEVQSFRKILEGWGIPCEAANERGLLGPRAASLLSLLRHLVDPQDKATLVGVLRGPLFGHSDEQLFLHVRAGGTLRPYPPGSGLPEVCASLQKLDQWRLAVRWLPAGAAVNWLMRQSGLWALALTEGRSSVAQLRGLVDCMRRCSELGLTLAEAVADVVEKGSVELPGGRCGQRNAVRILNLHKAKGLEARVVFLTAPAVGFSSTIEHIQDRQSKGYFCLRKWRKPLAHPPDWAAREAQEQNLLQGERLRFLYVGATRARETLVVSVATRPPSRGAWRALEPFLVECPVWGTGDLEPPAVDCQPHTEAPTTLLDRRRPSWTKGTMALCGAFCKPTLPAADLGVDARDWGRLVHRLLEQRIRQPQACLLLLGRWFCFENPALLQALPAAIEMVEQATQSLLWDWVQDASLRLVEVPLAVKRGKQCLFGTIDLALRREDGWGLVDYKTDRQRLEALVGRYARQVEQYARSWTDVLDEPLRYSGIFAVREARLSLDLSPPGGKRGL